MRYTCVYRVCMQSQIKPTHIPCQSSSNQMPQWNTKAIKMQAETKATEGLFVFCNVMPLLEGRHHKSSNIQIKFESVHTQSKMLLFLNAQTVSG